MTRTRVLFDSGMRTLARETRMFFLVLRRERAAIDHVQWIDAYNRDAFTHDEAFVRFHTDSGGLVISEFDLGFGDVIDALAHVFPGIGRWNDVTPEIPLTEASMVLWRRN